jgi:hypothetical protein
VAYTSSMDLDPHLAGFWWSYLNLLNSFKKKKKKGEEMKILKYKKDRKG